MLDRPDQPLPNDVRYRNVLRADVQRATKPAALPRNPNFASGPCAKRPGWSLAALNSAWLGRSHRAAGPKARIAEVIERSRTVLEMPADWLLGVVPGSDTGAFEMAMWSVLGTRPVDVLAFETFSRTWAADIRTHLRIEPARVFDAPYGRLPDLSRVDPAHDLVLAWNGTTSGVRLPNADFIAPNTSAPGRDGLVICDATSAAFAMHLPWPKLDVVTWSWQKVLGGEAGHGMIALSPRAVARLESFTPAWPLPKVFRLTSGGRLNAAIFEGDTINTPSMLCVEDAVDGLRWAERVGGLPGLIARSEANLAAVSAWVGQGRTGSHWADFLAEDSATRSCTSMCLKIVDPWFAGLETDAQWRAVKAMAALLESERAAFDIAAHRDAGPGLRIWGGATVDTSDIDALLPWLDWAFATVKAAA